jgi:hypothetical protein
MVLALILPQIKAPDIPRTASCGFHVGCGGFPRHDAGECGAEGECRVGEGQPTTSKEEQIYWAIKNPSSTERGPC